MPRRWTAGDAGLASGLEYRVRQGYKGPDDLVLELLTPAGWIPVKMELGFLLADFFYENEDVLYPPAQGFKGGQMYLDACDTAAKRRGWRRQTEVLDREKSAKRRRDG